MLFVTNVAGQQVQVRDVPPRSFDGTYLWFGSSFCDIQTRMCSNQDQITFVDPDEAAYVSLAAPPSEDVTVINFFDLGDTLLVDTAGHKISIVSLEQHVVHIDNRPCDEVVVG